MKTVGVGIVGCGMISDAHFEAIQQVEELGIVGVTSFTAEKAERAALKLGCKAYANMIELIEAPEVELVVFLTPPGVHHELITHAIKNKKHLLVEKPMGTHLHQINEYVQTTNEAGLILSMVCQHRFDPASLFVRDKLDQHLLGKPIGANCLVNWYRPQSYYESWRAKKEMSGGGVLPMQAIHTLDLMLWFMGDVESIKAYTHTTSHNDIEVEDLAMASIRFKNDKFGTISASSSAYPGYPARLDIFGYEGSVTIEGDNVVFYRSKNDSTSISKESKSETVENPGKVSIDSIAAQYRDVVHAIKNGVKPLVSGEEALRVCALIDAIYRSASTGLEVKLA